MEVPGKWLGDRHYGSFSDSSGIIQSHMSESVDEVAFSSQLFPGKTASTANLIMMLGWGNPKPLFVCFEASDLLQEPQ